MKFTQLVIFMTMFAGVSLATFAQGLPASPHQNAKEILRAAKTVSIEAHSDYMNPEALERELVKHPDFNVLGMLVVRDAKEADLILQVYRKKWTLRFTVSALDARTKALVASCQESSIGGDIEPKLAQCFIRQAKAAKKTEAK